MLGEGEWVLCESESVFCVYVKVSVMALGENVGGDCTSLTDCPEVLM